MQQHRIAKHSDHVEVRFRPGDAQTVCPRGSTALKAAQQAGVAIEAPCGGLGICEACIVQTLSGSLSGLTDIERDVLRTDEKEAGMRMACQAAVLSDAEILVPESSRADSRRLVLEADVADLELNPAVLTADLVSPSRGGADPEAAPDLEAALAVAFGGYVAVDERLFVGDETALLENGEEAEAVVCGYPEKLNLVTIRRPSGILPGIAVDIGSTRLAGYLVDLSSGKLLEKAGLANPQIPFGEDVVSRIATANRSDAHLAKLRDVLRDALMVLVRDVTDRLGVSSSDIVDAVLVGNTAMHHFLTGLPVRQLGESPYRPASVDPETVPAASVALPLAPGARVYLPPLIAGFVGSDHLAVQTALKLGSESRTVIAVDIGTNTEVTLCHGGSMWTCSCASGPAFEGAHILHGMRAGPGAVEYVRFESDVPVVETIEGKPAAGICGSGIVDAIAMLQKSGRIDKRGRLLEGDRVRGGGSSKAVFVLVPEAEAATPHDIVVTRSDIHEIQLAKGAIRAGIEVLMTEAGIGCDEVNEIVLAGAFGTYLNPESVVAIGMLPPVPLNRIRQVGNAAGAGAVRMLLSVTRRREAEALRSAGHYIELMSHHSFSDLYMDGILF